MTIKQLAVRFVAIGNRLVEEGIPDPVVAAVVRTIFHHRMDERDDFEEIIQQIKDSYEWLVRVNKVMGQPTEEGEKQLAEDQIQELYGNLLADVICEFSHRVED